MKPNRKNLISQRAIVSRKLRPWKELQVAPAPPSGWVKAVRGSLGLTTRQLAERVGVDQSNITRLEEREPSGNVTLERLAKVAEAMNCKLVYAIVPKDSYGDLDDIIDARARNVAREIVNRTEHSMRLEKQGTPSDLTKQVDELAQELKAKMDSRIWSTELER